MKHQLEHCIGHRSFTRANAPSRGRALASAGFAGNHQGMPGTIGLSRLNQWTQIIPGCTCCLKECSAPVVVTPPRMPSQMPDRPNPALKVRAHPMVNPTNQNPNTLNHINDACLPKPLQGQSSDETLSQSAEHRPSKFESICHVSFSAAQVAQNKVPGQMY